MCIFTHRASIYWCTDNMCTCVPVQMYKHTISPWKQWNEWKLSKNNNGKKKQSKNTIVTGVKETTLHFKAKQYGETKIVIGALRLIIQFLVVWLPGLLWVIHTPYETRLIAFPYLSFWGWSNQLSIPPPVTFNRLWLVNVAQKFKTVLIWYTIPRCLWFTYRSTCHEHAMYRQTDRQTVWVWWSQTLFITLSMGGIHRFIHFRKNRLLMGLLLQPSLHRLSRLG